MVTLDKMCRTYNGGDINADVDYFYNIIKDLIDTKEIHDYDLYSHAQKYGRGNLCHVTIILHTLAMEVVDKFCKDKDLKTYEDKIEYAHQNKEEVKDKFIKYLKRKIADARDILIERYNHICSQSPASARFMYENGTMAGYVPSEGIISALRHGTLAIGQIAIAETLQILLGTNHKTEEGMEFAKEIETTFNQLCKQYKEDYKLNFGVYYTPKRKLWEAA